MRLYQQFRASIGRSAVAVAGVLVFASGMSMSASGQALQAQKSAAVAQAPALPPPQGGGLAGTPISIEEAVRIRTGERGPDAV